jgi:hypothetical protein
LKRLSALEAAVKLIALEAVENPSSGFYAKKEGDRDCHASLAITGDVARGR